MSFSASTTRTRAKATFVQNITDVDDEIIRRARELGIDASDLARGYERAYLRNACAAQRLRGRVRARQRLRRRSGHATSTPASISMPPTR
jgi:cysteinyl-tRNA synthetase